MQKSLIKIGLLAIVLAIFTSCKTHSHTYRSFNISNKSLDTENIIVDIKPDFKKKVKGSSTKKHDTENAAKEEAYFNAIIENNIDVLVDPIYSVSSTKKILFIFGGKSQAEVHGYAGYYKNPIPKSEYDRKKLEEKISKLEEFAQISNTQEVKEERTYTVNETCGDCKGNDPLTLVSVIENKESLLDAFEKFESVANNRDVDSKNNKKSLFFNKSDTNSVSKKNSLKNKVYNFFKIQIFGPIAALF